MLESILRPKRPWWLVVATLAGLGATLWLRKHASWTEANYSQGIYPAVRDGLARLGHGISVSVAWILLWGVVLWFLAELVRWVRAWKTGWVPATTRWLLRLARVGVGLYLLYLGLWGANQYRLPLEQRLLAGGPEGAAPSDRNALLVPLARALTDSLVVDRPQLEEAGFRVLLESGLPDPRVLEAIRKGFPGMPEWEGPDPALRAFPWPGLFARLGISGLFVPFTGEPHLLMDGPACRFPFRAFHEVAHQRGYAREDEANFLGWWLGSHSGDPHYRYSANLVAWEYVLDALRFADPEEAHRMIQSVPEGVRDDRARLRAYWRQFEGPLEAVGTAANNVFLKSQGQSHGVASYGRMVRLLLWDFDQRRVVR